MAARFDKRNIRIEPEGAERIIRELERRVKESKNAFDSINEVTRMIIDTAENFDVEMACIISAEDEKDEDVGHLGVLLTGRDPEFVLNALNALIRVLYDMADGDVELQQAMERVLKRMVQRDSEEAESLTISNRRMIRNSRDI